MPNKNMETFQEASEYTKYDGISDPLSSSGASVP